MDLLTGTKMHMNLRPYQPADWPRLCAIHDQARIDELRASGLVDAFIPLERAAENEGLFDNSVVVAEVEGRVLGFVAFSQDELSWLYVDPATYRRGIGRALLRYAIASCSGRMSAEVLVGNEPALRLYVSEGFNIIRRVDGRMTGNEAFAASGYLLERRP
jgi:ribosomal protein S18 acetylase RimI-like enzyme